MRSLLLLAATLSLGACASASTTSGFLTSYEGLAPRPGAVRASVAERQDVVLLAQVRRIVLEPTVFAANADAAWMTPAEREMLAREIDAQLCFELTERYDIALDATQADARVRTAVTMVKPTGKVGSAASAVAGYFIPGPIGLRVPGTVGSLAAETEMVSPDGRQLAAISWNRAATPIGTDDPSFSRIGDALQFAEPYADAAGQTMTVAGAPARAVAKPDPCTAYGPRFRPEGFLAKFATGLYVPQMSGAKPADAK
jgi:hypothetical protein